MLIFEGKKKLIKGVFASGGSAMLFCLKAFLNLFDNFQINEMIVKENDKSCRFEWMAGFFGGSLWKERWCLYTFLVVQPFTPSRKMDVCIYQLQHPCPRSISAYKQKLERNALVALNVVHSFQASCLSLIINWKALSFIKVTAHKETQVSFGSIQKSSVCFGCPQLGTLQHTASFRNSLAPFEGNFILDQWSVYGMHGFLFFRNTYWKYLLWNSEHWQQNSMHSDYIRTEAIWSPQAFLPLGFFRTFGLSVSPFALLNVSITSLVILYTRSFSYPRYCLVEHVSNLSLLNPELVVE